MRAFASGWNLCQNAATEVFNSRQQSFQSSVLIRRTVRLFNEVPIGALLVGGYRDRIRFGPHLVRARIAADTGAESILPHDVFQDVEAAVPAAVVILADLLVREA